MYPCLLNKVNGIIYKVQEILKLKLKKFFTSPLSAQSQFSHLVFISVFVHAMPHKNFRRPIPNCSYNHQLFHNSPTSSQKSFASPSLLYYNTASLMASPFLELLGALCLSPCIFPCLEEWNPNKQHRAFRTL